MFIFHREHRIQPKIGSYQICEVWKGAQFSLLDLKEKLKLATTHR
jgi:hypothetical protein